MNGYRLEEIDNEDSDLVRCVHFDERIVKKQRDFLSRLGVVEQRVALLVDKRRRI